MKGDISKMSWINGYQGWGGGSWDDDIPADRKYRLEQIRNEAEELYTQLEQLTENIKATQGRYEDKIDRTSRTTEEERQRKEGDISHVINDFLGGEIK